MTDQDIQIITTLSNFCTGAGTMLLAIGAIWGLSQWRNQMQYKEKYDVARKVGYLASRFENEFRTARSPGTFAYEYINQEGKEDETKEEKSMLDEGHARFERLKPLQITLRELNEINWEAELVLETDFSQLIETYDKSYRQLYAAVVTSFNPTFRRKSVYELNDQEIQRQEKMHNIIYGLDDDEIGLQVKSTTSTIKQRVRSILRSGQENIEHSD